MNTPTAAPSSAVPGPSPEVLERMLAAGRESALLRMSLALAYHLREDEQTAPPSCGYAALSKNASFRVRGSALTLISARNAAPLSG